MALCIALLLTFSGTSLAETPTFSTQQVISRTVQLAIDVRTADLDGDGDTDILLASYNGGIFWFENDGAAIPNWTQHFLVTQPGVDGAFSVFAARIDGDADLDLLSASFNDQLYLWYENALPSSTWGATEITFSAREAQDVWADDLDGDGDNDVLAGSTTDQWLDWFENDGGSPPVFGARHRLSNGDAAVTMQAADIDRDGDNDVVTGSRWYENVGGTPPAFTPRVYATSGGATVAIFVADVDGDEDPDILGASGSDDRIAWYENDGGSPPSWTQRTISTNAALAQAVHGTDLDGDGDLDVVSGSADDDKIAWYENDGVSPPAWTEHVISTSAFLARSVYAADVDGDGDADVLSASWDTLTLYLNDSAQPLCENDQECVDTLFCNGVESCSGDACEPGIAPCTPADFCNEAEDRCVDCVINPHCSDGQFCNGVEICDANGECNPGSSPCTRLCRESDDRCVMCLSNADCVDDGLFCNGTPRCDGNGNCSAGTPPCPTGTCNEASDSCTATAGAELWVSFDGTVAVPDGVGTVQDEDVVAWSTSTGQWSLVFDGSDVGLASAAIAGLARLPDGQILLSFEAPFNVPGLAGGPSGTSVDDSDIVRFTPTSLGANTAGSFTFYFDGSDVGLTQSQEALDAIDIAPDGRLVVSTSGAASATGASGEDEDLLIFTASSLGAATAGSFAVRFDGSDVGLTANDEDLDAACDTSDGSLLLSTLGGFTVIGSSGSDEDVLQFAPSSLGPTTTGSYGIFLDTSTEGIATSADVSAVEIKQ